MRIKSLAAIASFILASITMSSCLGESENIEYSPNAIVMAFELDAVNGVNCLFTIDQLNGQIYNQDSLPVGADTIIDKILITKLSIAGIATVRNSANTEDSLLNISDSLNFVGTMQTPFKFKVWAPDLVNTKDYSLEVRVHQQDKDSLDWGSQAWATNFAPAITGKQKSILLNNQIMVYGSSSSSVYYSSVTNGKTWSSATISGLPNTDITSIVNLQETLYATVSDNTTAYTSTDGIAWQESSLGSNIVTFIAPINNIITAIKTFDEADNSGTSQTVERFCNTDGSSWTTGNIVPTKFPRTNISYTNYTSSVGLENIMIVGNIINPTESDTLTTPWAYIEGQEWAPMSTDSKYGCPLFEQPSIMYYGNNFYIFGEKFDAFYKSKAGIVWKEETSKFLFPEEIRGVESDYSMVVGPNNFIWIMRSTPNAVWRGRLNQLGFLVQ